MINGLQFGQIKVYGAHSTGGWVGYHIGVTNQQGRDKALFENTLQAKFTEGDINNMGGWYADEWLLTTWVTNAQRLLVAVFAGHQDFNNREQNLWNAPRLGESERDRFTFDLLRSAAEAGAFPTLNYEA